MTPFMALSIGTLSLTAPLGLLYGATLFRRHASSLSAFVLAGVFALVMFVAVPWSLSSVYARWLLPVVFVGVAARITRRTGPTILALTAWILGAAAFPGRSSPAEAASLSLPLRDGRFAVLQGGGSVGLNPFHRADSSERYAVDFVRLGALGNRARRLLPRDPADYLIFGDTVYSPCSAEVAEAEDGRPDQRPGVADRKRPAGNHVILRCADVWVLLAHLREGSVMVRSGQSLRAGEPIGLVGNSGNTSEPHLHIQATRATALAKSLRGTPVPILFDGRFLVTNNMVHAR